jgi:hypothetical protein
MAVDQDRTHDQSGKAPLIEFRCTGCGYGASCRIAPERCPMCSASVWEYQPWRPYASLVPDLGAETPLTREVDA